MSFIVVHTPSGQPLYVNVDHILEIHEDAGHTVIEYEGPDQHRDVLESAYTIARLIACDTGTDLFAREDAA